jgi:CheY-like chemotaxis protein
MLRIRPDLPIILCSGYSAAVSPEMVRALGIRKFLLKPPAPLDLATAMRSVLEKKDG